MMLVHFHLLALVALLTASCGGQVSDDRSAKSTGGADGLNAPSQEVDEPTCPLTQLFCDRYFPQDGCVCNFDSPSEADDCPEGTYLVCKSYQPPSGCRCSSTPEDIARRHQKSGCPGASASEGPNGSVLPIIPLCAHEVENDAPTWAETAQEPGPDADSCPAPYTGGDISWSAPLANLNHCDCVAKGGTPLNAQFPNVGWHYAGCADTELLPSARTQAGGYCARAIKDDFISFCGWFTDAFLPAGWEITSCANCGT